jgi:hypothetical protein
MQFLPGNHSGGRRKGVRNAITSRMLDELDRRMIETGAEGNPLLCLHTIMCDADNKVGVRIAAAGKLLDVLVPKQLDITDDSNKTSVRIDKMVLALSGYFKPPQGIESAQPKSPQLIEGEVIDVTPRPETSA